MSTTIHPTAIVDSNAQIGDDVSIGPYCVIDANVTIGDRCKLYQNVFVTGWTTVGDDCILHPNAIVGHEAQDTKYRGERTFCEVGRGSVIRENVTIHRGTEPESRTVVGEDCFFLAGSHVGHNCTVGNRVTLINNALLGGHVSVGDRATLGGAGGIHQFVRIGELVMVPGTARVVLDVVPFALTDPLGRVAGINRVGLRRASYDRESVDLIRRAYRLLFHDRRKPFAERVAELAEVASSDAERRILEFVQCDSKRGFAGQSRD